jgi:lipopolysaccharide exporter
VRPTFLVVVRIVALVTVPVGVLLSATADPFTAAIFGPDWAPMAGPLAVVGIWAAVRPVEATIAWLLNSLGRAGVVGWVAVFVLVPLAVGLVLAVSTDDLAVVACVPLADTLLSLGILTALAHRHAELAPGRLWRSLSPIVIAGAGCWVVGRVVSGAAAGLPALATLVLAVAAGTAVYLMVLAAVDRSVITTAVAQLGRVLGRRGSPTPAA